MMTYSNCSYNQYSKRLVRHSVLSWAVEILTSKREQSCCVERNYVRRVYDYFVMTEDDSRDKREALRIHPKYISNWEKLHDVYTSVKHPEDLTVCYLSGPEPDNDFKEMIALGILPQNIWAFESDSQSYRKAILSYNNGQYPQPRIIKQNVEVFFSQTPKKFDIIYIDACGSIASSKHALKCISSICLNHRLTSPGVIISNFAEPDKKFEYYNLISQYLFFKKEPTASIAFGKSSPKCSKYEAMLEKVKIDFDTYYGDFISAVLRDIPSIIIPIQRIAKNPYLNQLLDPTKAVTYPIDFNILDLADNNSIAKYFFSFEASRKDEYIDERSNAFIKEIGNYDDLILGLKLMVLLQKDSIELRKGIREIKEYFDNGKNIYQFLDKPHSNLFFDVIINQLAYPLHYNITANKRYRYISKSTLMYTDVSIYDECRYIYEWLPALDQMISAFENISLQYVFRFALDGLVKMRQLYNNEFFFQGSVLSNSIAGFEKKQLAERIIIK